MLRSVQGKLVLAYLLLVLLAMQLSGLYLYKSLESYYLNKERISLRSQAQVLAGLALRYLAAAGGPDTASLANLVAGWSAEAGSVAILDGNGKVLAASGVLQPLVGNRLATDEVTHALGGSLGVSPPLADRAGHRFQAVAAPVFASSRVVGVVYLQGSLEPTYEVLANLRRLVLIATGLSLVLTALLGVLLARTITGPIREVTAMAAQMAQGDFSRTIPVRSQDEVGQLASMFNHLAGRLRETLEEISGERNKLETILAHMADGLLALDRDGRVIKMNRAAARMLGVDPSAALGRLPAEVWPHLDLPEPLAQALATGQPASSTVRVPARDGDRHLQAYVTPLRGSGAVVVLHDITELMRLETMRRDFVANVSHELKTPLTTVKSYVETLLDGAVEDPELRTRFLQVVASETDRMVRLVRDLLQLSQLDAGTVQWDVQPLDVCHLVEEALARLAVAADQKELRIHREFAPGLPCGLVDRDKFLQVLLNILANAIEFTPAGGDVWVAMDQQGDFIRVRVRDTGIGIPRQDLPRIFERFYRVEKGRSRRLGGTGLGLAIARQIVEALGGSIAIESELGRGTEVTFTVPAAPGPAGGDGL